MSEPAVPVARPTYFPAPAVPRTAPVGTREHPIPLIIDSDPGLDDALAIGLAVALPEINLLAVTTVGGNADVRHCTTNALRLLHVYGASEVPVAEGSPGALVGEVVRATAIHGEAGIGNTVLPESPVKVSSEHAVDLIARILREHPEPVAIAPIGPLTNIALLLRLHPELAPRISHLSIMGGSIGDGNTTAAAEFNIYADPEAAAIVFESGVPITMMGLDVTHQAVLYQPAVERLQALGTRSGSVAGELAAYALAREGQWYGTPRMSVHDAVAVAHLAIGDLVVVADYDVQVDTGSGPARGRTVCDGLLRRVERKGRTVNAQVGIAIDRDRFEDLMVDAYSRLP
ncbi:MAG TPA: nucleoside hydrolase [Candidatus Limnocylindrales bacterium]|nr:nucleoside hydrolase [Candidatus Limnocylindrales bacterium]